MSAARRPRRSPREVESTDSSRQVRTDA